MKIFLLIVTLSLPASAADAPKSALVEAFARNAPEALKAAEKLIDDPSLGKDPATLIREEMAAARDALALLVQQEENAKKIAPAQHFTYQPAFAVTEENHEALLDEFSLHYLTAVALTQISKPTKSQNQTSGPQVKIRAALFWGAELAWVGFTYWLGTQDPAFNTGTAIAAVFAVLNVAVLANGGRPGIVPFFRYIKNHVIAWKKRSKLQKELDDVLDREMLPTQKALLMLKEGKELSEFLKVVSMQFCQKMLVEKAP